MKRIIALLAVAATLLSLSACKVNREKTPEDIAAEESKAVAESIKAEEDFQEGKSDTVGDLGKTEKGKRIVVQEPGPVYEEFNVFEFDRKQNLKKRYRYLFFDDVEQYELKLNMGDGVRSELVKHDDKARLIVFEVEFEKDPELTYDYIYNTYDTDFARENNIVIIK